MKTFHSELSLRSIYVDYVSNIWGRSSWLLLRRSKQKMNPLPWNIWNDNIFPSIRPRRHGILDDVVPRSKMPILPTGRLSPIWEDCINRSRGGTSAEVKQFSSNRQYGHKFYFYISDIFLISRNVFFFTSCKMVPINGCLPPQLRCQFLPSVALLKRHIVARFSKTRRETSAE